MTLGADDTYLFRHALTRDAAYQLMLPQRRAALHVAAAEAQADAPVERYQHLAAALQTFGTAADATLAEVAAHAAMDAAAWCLERRMLGGALEYARAAADSGRLEMSQQIRALRHAYLALFEAGRFAEAVPFAHRARDAAEAAGDDGSVGDAVSIEAGCAFNLARISESLQLYALARDAFARAGRTIDVSFMWRAIGNSHHFAMRLDDAAAAYREAMRTATGDGSEIAIARVELGRASLLAEDPQHVGDAVRAAEAAVGVIQRVGGFRIRISARFSAAAVFARCGLHERAIETLRLCVRDARESGNASILADGHRVMAQSFRELGRLEEAGAAASFAVASHEQAMNPNGLCESLSVKADILLRLGRAAEAVPLLERALALIPQIEHPGLEEEILIALMQALKAAGRDSEVPVFAERLANVPPGDSLHH